MTKISRLTPIVEVWIDEAVEEHGGGENIRWEIGISPMQTNPHTPPEPTVILLMWIPGALVGQPIGGICPLPDPLNLNEVMVKELVPQFLRHLRETRSQALSQAQQPNAASPNGTGLIIP